MLTKHILNLMWFAVFLLLLQSIGILLLHAGIVILILSIDSVNNQIFRLVLLIIARISDDPLVQTIGFTGLILWYMSIYHSLSSIPVSLY